MPMSTVMEEKVNRIENAIESWGQRNKAKADETAARLLQVEQALVSHNPGAPLGLGGEKSLGQIVLDSEQFASFRKGSRSTGQIPIGAFKASTITSGPWTTGPDFSPRIAAPPMP